MSEKFSEKLLSASIPAQVADAFLEQADERGFKKKRALSAAVKLWAELPREIQANLMDLSLDSSAFVEMVHNIVNEYVGTGKEKEPSKTTSRKSLREAIGRIKEMVEIEQQQPGTIYRVLDKDEQRVLDEFRKLVAPKGRKRKTRSA